MNNIMKALFAACAVIAASQASAASQSADVPVTLEIVPACVWRSAVNDPSLLTTPNSTTPILTQFNVAATCNEGTVYTITADAQYKIASKNGEGVKISLHKDASRSTYLADMPISGVAGPLSSTFYFDQPPNVNEVVYLKVTGEGAGGGFVSGGVIPLTTFTLTINY